MKRTRALLSILAIALCLGGATAASAQSLKPIKMGLTMNHFDAIIFHAFA